MREMDWNSETRLRALIALPWTIRIEHSDDDGGLVARVIEMPDAIATGASERELAADLFAAVKASLEVRLENGDPIPVPDGQELPWERSPEPERLHMFRLGDRVFRLTKADVQPAALANTRVVAFG